MATTPARRVSWRLWGRLLAYVRPHAGLVTAATFAAVVAAGAAACSAWLLGPLVEAVLRGGQVQLGPVALSVEDLTVRVPLFLVSLSVLKAVAAWLHAGMMATVAQRVLGALRRGLFGNLLRLAPRWFEERHSGELLSRFTADVTQVEFAVSQALSSWAKDGLQVIALLVVCFLTDWRLFLLTFIVIPGMVLPVTRFARSTRKAAAKSQASLGVLSTLAAEQLHNLPVIQAYATQDAALEAFDAEQRRYLEVMKRSLLLRGAFTPTTEFIGLIGLAFAVAVGARAVAVEPALASKLLSFLAAALFLYQPMKALSGTFSQVMQGLGAAERLFEVIDATPTPDASGTAAPLTHALRFEDVRLRYANGTEALQGLSFEVPARKMVALVGASGAGKSSALSVLLGFESPSGGDLAWDDVRLSTLSRASVRSQLAWVPQEPVLLSGSVRENLRVSRPDASDELLWQALERAHAATFVKGFAAGLDEDVGERGSRLSGGQRQRLAIARAFLKEPSLLVLDEPTSALDAASEVEVQAGLAELMQGRTTLVVAHRLSTIRKADLIVVMEAGRVAEQGTHSELMARAGVYARLVAAFH